MAKFNRSEVHWVKVHEKKIREKRKLRGTELKHKAGVKAVSGKRTAKHQRKVEHRRRMDEKRTAEKVAAAEAVLLGSSDAMPVEDVEIVAPAAVSAAVGDSKVAQSTQLMVGESKAAAKRRGLRVKKVRVRGSVRSGPVALKVEGNSSAAAEGGVADVMQE